MNPVEIVPGRPSPAVSGSTVRLGPWTFVPGAGNAGNRAQAGFLHSNTSGQRVLLPHCHRLLAELLYALSRIERDLAARWPAEGAGPTARGRAPVPRAERSRPSAVMSAPR